MYTQCYKIIHRRHRSKRAMQLWIYWWNATWLLRPGCTRLRAFLWFATIVAYLCPLQLAI